MKVVITGGWYLNGIVLHFTHMIGNYKIHEPNVARFDHGDPGRSGPQKKWHDHDPMKLT